MSQLVGSADGMAGFVVPNDIRLHSPSRNLHTVIARNAARVSPYVTRYWPGGGAFMGDGATDVDMITGTWWGPIERIAEGAASRVGFIGTARDQYGAPLAGVTCSLFRTSDRQWIMDFTSRSDGTFFLQSWYSPDTHFIVFAKSGSPDVFGTTKQTLVGA